ncbi:pleiotropic drug resistance protein 1-like [Cicer arietinum]|uniref:Pleiotropic drug resistance protein 1-like n=1 Tax=Cicer arietinum TaxID=3827 RepID=A0A1S2YMD2_CICAR|nr:pleiotropic drug resistance protein 1-like [Cicer arietinum]
MDGGDIYRASSSLRGNNSTVFSRSSRHDEDDEEALKWAALEKLPTYNRVRKGLLITSHGEANEIDVTKLGFQERQELLNRLVNANENDNENFLLRLKERIDRVGIDVPTVEVRYEHLTVEAEAYVGSRALPSFTNFTIGAVENILSFFHIRSTKKKHVTILKDVSGIVKPQRMTLLLGPPSSGKTTLLLALAGKLDKTLKVSGRVTYNGHGMEEFVPQRTAAYISQNDVHIGEMTVRETLAFSARCQGVGTRYDLLSELIRREKQAKIKPEPDIDVFMKAAAAGGQEESLVIDYMLKILGLDVCSDTIVGDGMRRGISGGQRKRVTTGEMLVGAAKVLLMDEISTGLDSSTTFQIVKSIRQSIHIFSGTAVISLLQPAPETYELFDDIILLSDGQIVYQGPLEHVLEFFESLGFKCPDRKAVADFLQEVTSRKDQEQYWVCREKPYRFVTVTQFAEAFQSFHVGRRIGDELAIPFDKSKNHPAALTTKKYGVDKKELLKANFSREYLLMKKNSFIYISKLFQLSATATIAMTLFLRTNMHKDSLDGGIVYLGALFFSLIMLMFNGTIELTMTIVKLPTFFKQRDHLFYPAWAYAIPTWVIRIPVTLIEASIWVIITYYPIGFDSNVWRCLKQFLLLLLINQTASGLFRSIAAICRDYVVGTITGFYVLLIFVASGGFVLAKNDIKKWWSWGYWISPLMYAQNAVVVNEFLGHSWDHVAPDFGLGNQNTTLGIQVLEYRNFFTHAYWYWIGVGALTGFMFFWNIIYSIALTYLGPYNKQQATITEESEGSNTPNDKNREVELQQLENSGRSNAIMDSSTGKKRGMVLPFEPYSITFDEIEYSVNTPQEMKDQGIIEDRLVLLKGVSGAFRPGVLTALVGVSGAGKTTLMDVLAGRKTTGHIDGSIKISGYPKNQDTFARISGYCEQNDIHSPHVTVHESLLYSAWLRLPTEVDSNTRKIYVEEIMELVELNPLRNSLVGLPGVSGLSTEQRKRLTIAVELVANPSIIFMDEPTSGLDARAAAIVMRTVRNTVDTGRTVVCTIHQPNIDIFEAFDDLFLLKRGGQEIYVGPLGRYSCHLINYFESIEGVSKIKDGYNPATWMLEVTSPAQELALGVDFHEIYKNSDLYRRNKQLIEELGKPIPGSKEFHFPTQYSQPFFIQCLACLWKQNLSYWRNSNYTAVRFYFATFIALVFGTMFWNLGSKFTTSQGLYNALGSMYGAVLFIGVQNSSSVQSVVDVERTVFYRERAAGMYSALPYAVAQVVVELPYILAQAVSYGVIVYAMIGFEWTVTKFFWYLFFMYFTFCYFTFYGMMTVAFTPNHHIAAITAAAFYGLWNVFSGFVIPRPKMPVWWRWYAWADPVAWTLYGLFSSQFGDITAPMKDLDGLTVQEFIRIALGMKHDFVGVCAVVIVGIAVLFAFTFAVSIKVFSFQQR